MSLVNLNKGREVHLKNFVKSNILFFVLVVVTAFFPNRALANNPVTKINLKCTADTGTFARYVLSANDKRDIVVRRGKEMGFNYGLETKTSNAIIQGHKITIAEISDMRPSCFLSANTKTSTYTLIKLPDAEVLIPRAKDGFTEEDVQRVLKSIDFI